MVPHAPPRPRELVRAVRSAHVDPAVPAVDAPAIRRLRTRPADVAPVANVSELEKELARVL